MKVFVTGAAGFIGFHLVKALLNEGKKVVGLDNINAYYDPNLKYGRLEETGISKSSIHYNQLINSTKYPNYQFIQLNLEDRAGLEQLFHKHEFTHVCHLAAQAGVRYSIENPYAYIDSNIVGFINILENCRHHQIQHLVYASSSSIYGLNESIPFSTKDGTNHPVSLYAATKKSNELMAHAYSHLYNLPTTGLRFFTVYGPWGRPDMAYFLFTDAILSGRPIKVFNNGAMSRDFTYVDDVVAGVVKVLNRVPTKNEKWSGLQADPSSSSQAPYKVYNIGNDAPINLLEFIECIEDILCIKAEKNFLPLQAGDAVATWADVSDLITDFNYHPQTPLKEGIKTFVNWYKKFYQNADMLV